MFCILKITWYECVRSNFRKFEELFCINNRRMSISKAENGSFLRHWSLRVRMLFALFEIEIHLSHWFSRIGNRIFNIRTVWRLFVFQERETPFKAHNSFSDKYDRISSNKFSASVSMSNYFCRGGEMREYQRNNLHIFCLCTLEPGRTKYTSL